MCQFISKSRVPDNTLLVAGQRRFNSTQIVDGAFFNSEPLAADIHAICARYAAVVLKPHPLDRHHSLLAVASGAPARILGVIDDNVYRMMAMPQISAVLTVNSGLAHEAPYFGKRVHTLAPLSIRSAWRGAEADTQSHASLDDVVLTPDFWRTVLAPHAPVTAADGMRLPPKPNRLRIALDSFWNYQQIDTDRIAARIHAANVTVRPRRALRGSRYPFRGAAARRSRSLIAAPNPLSGTGMTAIRFAPRPHPVGIKPAQPLEQTRRGFRRPA